MRKNVKARRNEWSKEKEKDKEERSGESMIGKTIREGYPVRPRLAINQEQPVKWPAESFLPRTQKYEEALQFALSRACVRYLRRWHRRWRSN